MKIYGIICWGLFLCKTLAHSSLFPSNCAFPLETFKAKKYHSAIIPTTLQFDVVPDNSASLITFKFDSPMEILTQVDNGIINLINSNPTLKSSPKTLCSNSRLSSDDNTNSWTVRWSSYTPQSKLVVIYSNGKKLYMSNYIINDPTTTSSLRTSSFTTFSTVTAFPITSTTYYTNTTTYITDPDIDTSSSTISTSTTTNPSTSTSTIIINTEPVKQDISLYITISITLSILVMLIIVAGTAGYRRAMRDDRK